MQCEFTFLAILTVTLMCTGFLVCFAGEGKSLGLKQRAAKLHAEAIVIDTHSDTALRMLDPAWDFMARHETGHMDYPRIKEGGLDAVFLAVYLGKQKPEEPGIAVKKAMDLFDRILGLAENYPDLIELARTAADIRRISGSGKLALLIGVEGGHLIESNLEVLRCYYRLGARYMTLTHSFHHDWADSAGFRDDLPPLHGGLTDFGRDVIREMNRIGMMVDISHVSDDTFRDGLEVAEAPVSATHAGARGLCPSRRNLTDAMIRSLAAKGGVVQLVFFNGFLDPEYPKKLESAKKKWAAREKAIRKNYGDDGEKMKKALREVRKEIPVEGTPLSLLIDHIDRIVQRVGPDHAGLGADWDGVWSMVDGMEDCSKLPAITYELLKRGYGEEDVKKILGGNLLRVMEEVERTADRMKRRSAGSVRPR